MPINWTQFLSGFTPTARVRLLLIRHAESLANVNAHRLGGQQNTVELSHKGVHQAALLGKRLKFDAVQMDRIYTSTAQRAIRTYEISTRGLVDTNNESQKEKSNVENAPLVSSDVLVTHHPELLEQDQGEWEGQSRSETYTPQVIEDMRVQVIRSRSNCTCCTCLRCASRISRLFIILLPCKFSLLFLCVIQHMDFAAPSGESLRVLQSRVMNFLLPQITLWANKSHQLSRTVTLSVYAHGGSIRCMIHALFGGRDEWTWLVGVENTSITEIVIDHRGVQLVRANDSAHLKYSMEAPQHTQQSPIAEKHKL